MDKDYTHITVILDRTGSMESIRDDTIGGFNAFLKEQKALAGKATLTLVQFDSREPYEVLERFKPIKKVLKLTRDTYVPRASTPLFDALGRGINDLEKSLGDMPDNKQPARVVMAIVTDGQENASREFTREQIVKMIKEKTDNSSWQFVFLSADLDAVGDAVSYGIQACASLPFMKNSRGTSSVWKSLSERTSEYRNGKKKKIGFVDSDRLHPHDPIKKQKSHE